MTSCAQEPALIQLGLDTFVELALFVSRKLELFCQRVDVVKIERISASVVSTPLASSALVIDALVFEALARSANDFGLACFAVRIFVAPLGAVRRKFACRKFSFALAALSHGRKPLLLSFCGSM
jgi:hypothetical protein